MKDGSRKFGQFFFQSVFANVASNLERAPRTLRQRRWRANRKIRPYPTQLSSLIPPVEPINEEDLHSPFVDENYEDNPYDDEYLEDNPYGDEYLEDNPYGDEYLEADTLEDDYDLSLNQIGIESNEKCIEQELDEPLYDGAPVSFKCYHKEIVDFGNLVQLTDSNMNKLLKLIRNALPFTNKLLKSYKKVVSLFQKKSSFNEVLRCTNCLEIINNNYCSIICERNDSQRLVGGVVEHLSTDRSNTQLIDVIRRNKQLIINYPQLVDKLLQCDVMTQLIYKEKQRELQATSNDTYPITLMLHIDSTPIVHWSRKHTWFVTASIVEIPPSLRENHLNLLLLSIWNAPIKPDVDLLLMDICDTIKQILFVDDMKFSIDVLLFKADLPARALATKHVHHNGYYACLECDQQGVWCDEGRFVAYPYIQSAINLRTSAHLDMCAKLLSQQSSGGNYCGVKGISPLTKILDIPTQIDLDSMHLCFIGHCSLLLSKWEKMVVKEAWLSSNEFLKDSLSLRVCDTRFDNHRSATQSSSSIFNSATASNTNYVAPVTSTQLPAKKRRTAPGVLVAPSTAPLPQLPAKKRRTAPGVLVAPSTAPLPRKRFNPAIQSTAASLMRNFVPGETTVSSNVVAENTRSISETKQNGFNQTMKLCEDANQLMKDMLKQTTEQTRLMNELINCPRELQKTTQQLSHIVHMQAKVSQAQQNNNDHNLTFELNGIDISHVSRGSSLNATARSLIRAAYGESASYNNLVPGEFDSLLGFLAHIHGLHAAAVFADCHSIKNSLQQMKHDINKKGSSSYSSMAASKQRTSTTIEIPSILHDDDDDDDDDDTF
ncbi:unnamed protein product [Rotaria magnacalcarata]|uniref:Uncharacterized protein n=5 Tax=Rotaria magnacalcarata TaxID=392030 RepID=A0A816A3W0_9BILA|nr:unnamed protein product [Rotaria magnacalcarata]